MAAVVYSTADKIEFIESVFGRGKLARNGKNFDVWCPMCAPRDRGKRKLAIRVIDDANHCWTCGWRARTLAPLIKKYGSYVQLETYRRRFAPPEPTSSRRCIVIDVSGAEREVEPVRLPDDFTLLPLASSIDPDANAARRKLESRGLTERDQWYYRLGVSNEPQWYRRIIMPSFGPDGELNYFTGRAIDRQRMPKYDNPEADKTSIVFNELFVDWSRRLVICEGPFDYVKCGDNAVPLLGSSLNEESRLFNMITLHSTPVAVALDEELKNSTTQRVARKLVEYDIDVVIVDITGHGDPGEMTRKEFTHRLAQARAYSWKGALLGRLQDVAAMDLSL